MPKRSYSEVAVSTTSTPTPSPKAELRRLRCEKAELTRQAKAAKQKEGRMQRQIEQLEQRVDTESRLVVELTVARQQLAARIGELEEEKRSLKEMNDELHDELTEMEEQDHVILEENFELENRNSKLEKTNDELNNTNQELLEFVDDLQKKRDESPSKEVRALREWSRAQRATIRGLKRDFEQNAGVQPWKECEICRLEYSDADAARTPRVLPCGHTMCTKCAQSVREGTSLKCPFDRRVLFCKRVAALPKNLLVFHM